MEEKGEDREIERDGGKVSRRGKPRGDKTRYWKQTRQVQIG